MVWNFTKPEPYNLKGLPVKINNLSGQIFTLTYSPHHPLADPGSKFTYLGCFAHCHVFDLTRYLFVAFKQDAWLPALGFDENLIY